jgi:hypothetical protein
MITKMRQRSDVLRHRGARRMACAMLEPANMFTKTISVVALLGLAACAADRNRDIKRAETERTNEQAEARYEEERLARQQAAERAAVPPASEERMQLDREQAEERAKTTTEANEEIAKADQDVAKAHTDMRADRTKFETDAKARVTKADAKARAGKQKIAKAGPDKRVLLKTNADLYDKQKKDVETAIGNLSRASNDDWQDAKARLEKQLDALEATADKLQE